MADPAQYDAFANIYTTSTATSLHNAYIERPAMLSLIGPPAGLDILDLGCGTLVLGCQLLDAGAKFFTGMDASPEMLELARARLDASPKHNGRTLLLQHDLALPLTLKPEESYDLIISSLALHYLPSWHAVLASAIALLRPSGRFIFSVHHPFTDWANHPSSSYHETPVLVTEQWDSVGQNDISFYRRSLGKMGEEIHEAGWIVERLVEPRPVEEAREIFGDERFQRVARKPSFIIFCLIKATRS